jgi:cysteine desulfurase
MNRIFFDNSATTPLEPRVLNTMTEAMRDNFGNPSSIHAEGRRARAAIEQARKTVAGYLNCSIGEIFFTSGGTEANNMALKNAVRDLGVQRIISSPIEHHCVLHSLATLEKTAGIQVDWVRVDATGRPELEHLEELLAGSDAKTLVSLMHANNEIGTRIDLDAVAQRCRDAGAYFHCDTVQTVGYYPIDLEATPLSFMSGSAHKFHGPKGVGFIYINNDNQIQPYLDGGAQERNMRGGTENLYGIVGLAEALRLAYEELPDRRAHIAGLRERLWTGLRAAVPDVQLNGDWENGHYKLLSVSFPPSAKADLLLLNLDMAGISASGGSACSSGVDVGSHVLDHLEPGSPRKTIRFSLSHFNTAAEVDRVVEELRKILA